MEENKMFPKIENFDDLIKRIRELETQLREAKKRQFYCHERKEPTCDHQCANCAEWYRLVLEKTGETVNTGCTWPKCDCPDKNPLDKNIHQLQCKHNFKK